jgi:hypothetical protein
MVRSPKDVVLPAVRPTRPEIKKAIIETIGKDRAKAPAIRNRKAMKRPSTPPWVLALAFPSESLMDTAHD